MFKYEDNLTFKNPIAGNPTLFVQGIFDTIDGYTEFDSSDYRPILFTPTESYTTVDGYTEFDATDYRPITQAP
jgi:hypothetical protein